MTDTLNLETLRAANLRRQAEWDPGSVVDLTWRGNELAGEVGEACNVIKKLERERRGLPGSRDTVEHLAQELADVIICVDLIAMGEGIDLAAAVIAKFNATSEKVGLATRLPDLAEDEDADRCIACALAFKPDDMVLLEAEGGYIHAACCGPERESYFKGGGEPLAEGDPIPTPFRYGDDQPTAGEDDA